MGCCLSKTTHPSSSSQKFPYQEKEPQTCTNQLEIRTKKLASSETEWKKKSEEEEEKKKRVVVGKGTPVAEEDNSSLPSKRPVFVVQHRKTDEPNVSSSASDVSTPNSEKNPKREAVAANIMAMAANGAVVRTSSCTKEEVDAILIQCGRLSRSSSGKGGGGSTNVSAASGRKYSGSKRSHDFDRENEATIELSSDSNGVVSLHDNKDKDNDNDNDNYNDERQRRRQSRGSHRRRTPSRSRERADQQQSRSGSKERAVGNRRRVSRSPGRRSESPITSSAPDANPANNNGNHTSCSASSSGNNIGKPGKMVSVPATVSSLSMEKTNNAGEVATTTKRVLVKRNAGGGGDGSLRSIASPRSRSPARSNVAGSNGVKSCSATTEVECSGAAGSRGVASPRSRSPARVGSSNGVKGGGGGISEVGNNNGQQIQGSLTRNSSRKAEHSPYRRTPLNELDINALPFQPLVNNNKQKKSKEVVVEEEEATALVVNRQPLGLASQSKSHADINSAPATKAGFHGAHRRTRSRGGGEGPDAVHINYCRVNENQPKCVEQPDDRKDNQLKSSKYDTAANNPTATSGTDNSLKVAQTMTRSRSSRRSRDLDINVDSLLSPHPTTANYNSLLLQDIQNFHQNGNANGNFNTINSKTNLSLNPNTPFTLPASVSKACSILEAVADLNSSTNSNLPSNFFDDREHTPSTELLSSKNMSSYSSYANKGSKDPFLVSEVSAGGDLLQQPSLHKYVTIRKRGAGESVEDDFEKEESCGSNSFTGSQYQHWVSPSSWEPNSADSTDCWTSKSRDISPLGLQRLSLAQNGSLVNGESQK